MLYMSVINHYSFKILTGTVHKFATYFFQRESDCIYQIRPTWVPEIQEN